MISFKALAGLSVLSQAMALPSFYAVKGGCEIPSTEFGKHSTPKVDETITFSVTDASGAEVMMWEAGGEYTLTITSYTGADMGDTNIWIHSTDGTLVGDGYDAATCGEAIFSTAEAETHTITWTAPAVASGCVTVSVAQAGTKTQGYNTNMVDLCPGGDTAVSPMADEPMADMPEEMGGEMAEEPEQDDLVAEAEEAVENATGGDEAEEPETTGAAVRATGTLAAIAAVAVALLAAV